ncbi:hypothetical protein [Fontivita pretiosa]|uniref:hypothetical protein n=1 Tax=Fontivita pretiosa TaxID=2989684 RepID=UPI003D17C72E
MKSAVVWVLAIINVLLLLSLVGRHWPDNTAVAQPAGRATGVRPGDYLMIPYQALGVSNGIVVVVDQSNGQLSAISYDDANRRFDMMRNKIDLHQIFQRGAEGERPDRGGPAVNPNRPANR